MGRTVIVVLLAAALSPALGQHLGRRFDVETYRLYQSAGWDSLLTLGERALESGEDSYLLRMRMGYASYYLEDYRTACGHFGQALFIEPMSDEAARALYWSLVYGGRSGTARTLLDRWPDIGGGSGSTFLDDFYAEFGRKTPDDQNQGHLDYGAVGVTQVLSNSFTLQHQAVVLRRPGPQGASQYQYLAAPNIRMTAGMFLNPALHVLVVRAPGYRRVNYVQHAEIGFEKGKWTVTASATRSRLNDGTQWQGRLSAWYFPFGNLKCYGTTQAGLHHDPNTPAKRYQPFVYQMAGIRLHPRLWLESGLLVGRRSNFPDQSSRVIYNSTDEYLGRWSLVGKMPLRKEWMPYVLMEYEKRFDRSAQNTYSYYNIIGGIEWNL